MASFLHDYGNLIAPTAAILNGFIAVLIAQFFKDHPVAKIVLVVAAGALGAAAIGATFYSQYQIAMTKSADDARRTMIRENLGTFIAEGTQITNTVANETNPLPLVAAQEWEKHVEVFVKADLGQSYLARLSDTTGATPLHFSNDAPHQYLRAAIYNTLLRLEEFSRELPQ